MLYEVLRFNHLLNNCKYSSFVITFKGTIKYLRLNHKTF